MGMKQRAGGALDAVLQASAGATRRLRAALDPGFDPLAPAPSPVSVTLDDVTAGYGGVPALEGVTGRFEPGSLTALVGPNGAGKTTLLNILAGVTQPRSGARQFEGAGPGAIGYLSQTEAIDRLYPISVLEFVALGRWRSFGAFRSPPYALLTEVLGALDAVGMQNAATNQIGALSVGQFRRVLFARLIVQRARLILLDEPFAALDTATATDLLGVLAAWHREGRTIVAALHDLDQVRGHFPATLLLARRVIAWGETGAVLTTETLARAGMGSVRLEARPGLLRVVPS